MNWKGKKVLVTSSVGFIRLCIEKRLLDLGCEVYVAENFSRGKKENI